MNLLHILIKEGNMSVEKLDNLNIWTNCKFKIIDTNTMKWKTISSVLDTPKHIQEEKDRLESKGYKNLWVFHVYGHEPLF